MKHTGKLLSVILAFALILGLAALPAQAAGQTVDTNGPLYKKTALFVGDSICHGQFDDSSGVPTGYAYAGRIGDWYGMTVDNKAYGGTTLSTLRSGRIITQFEGVKYNTYDYVVMEGGVNDAWGNLQTPNKIAPVGKISTSMNKKDFDKSTFAGALEELFATAVEYFPTAKLCYMSTFAMPLASEQGLGKAGAMEEYYAQAELICKKWGVCYLDLYHDPYVNNTLMRTSQLRYLRDPIHPNKSGYDRLAPYIGDFMECMCDRETVKRNPLASKRALFIGDSISFGSADSNHQGDGWAWAKRLAPLNGLYVTNGSTSGMPISTCRANQMYENITRFKDRRFDYVIMHGGVNDMNDKAPIGAMVESFDTKDFNRGTFAGGLEYLFATAKATFPDAKLGFIINYAINSKVGSFPQQEEYWAEAIKICKKWGVSYLDLYHNDEVNTALLLSSNGYMADVLHPRAAGYEFLTPYINRWVCTLSGQALVGDVNLDFKVDASDALLALKAAVNKFTPDSVQQQIGDTNSDEKLDASDALYMLKVAVGRLPAKSAEAMSEGN